MGEINLSKSSNSNLPDFLKKQTPIAIELTNSRKIYKPIIIDMNRSNSQTALKSLVSNNHIFKVIDNYDEQFAELYISKNAQLYKANLSVKRNSIRNELKEHYKNIAPWRKGSWVYYPWSGLLIHVLEKRLLDELLTIRNKILITHDEQEIWSRFRVGCAGMSVGSNGALGITITGGSRSIKLADGAVFSGSNLNRVRAGLRSVGEIKSIIVAREIYETNPYGDIKVFPENLNDDNLERFFTKRWKLDCVVDEIDDLATKVKLRQWARRLRIPLVMVTEPGDTLLIDVERYDKNPSQEFFNGRAKGIEDVVKIGFKNQREKIRYIMDIIGPSNLPIRDQNAMLKVGSLIPSPPQLGSTAMMAGGVISYVVRQIALGGDIKGGVSRISLPKLLKNGSMNYAEYFKHKRNTSALQKAINSM
jgi:tRNA threonylcarbamoyladenosine dehydratase